MRVSTESLRLSPSWRQRLGCLKCSAKLPAASSSDALLCSACGANYSIRHGVAHFAEHDEFYDTHGFVTTGRDFGSSPLGRLGLFYARHHYLYEISRAVPRAALVIEIGCGGGSRYLAHRYEMLGLELSRSSIRYAAQTYESVLQGTARQIPIQEGSVDAIVSSFFLEHIPDEELHAVFSEMARVLKPNGRMVHYFDLESDGPFFRWARNQRWYEDLFVVAKGHLGLRTLATWRALFEREGFAVQREQLFAKTWLQDLSVWSCLDDRAAAGLPRRLGKIASTVRNRADWIADVATTMMDDWLSGLFPDTWAAKAIVTLRKE